MKTLIKSNNVDYSASNILYIKAMRLCAKVNSQNTRRLLHSGMLTYGASKRDSSYLDLSGNELNICYIPGYWSNVSYGNPDDTPPTEVPIAEFVDMKSRRALVISACMKIVAGPSVSKGTLTFKLITDYGSTSVKFNDITADQVFAAINIVKFNIDGGNVIAEYKGYVYSRPIEVEPEVIEKPAETFNYDYANSCIIINGESQRAVGSISFFRITSAGKDVVVAEALRKEESAQTSVALYDYISKQYLIDNSLDYACIIDTEAIRLSNNEEIM